MRKTLILILASFLAIAESFGQVSNASRQEKIARLEREIGILDNQIKENQTRSADALSRLSLLQTKIRTREALVKESEGRVAEIDRKIARKKGEIAKLQARLDTMETYYARLVRSAYVNRNPHIWYMYILSSENVSQGMRRYTFLKNLSNQMKVQAGEIFKERERIEKEKSALDSDRAEANKIRNKRLTELQTLKNEASQLKQLSARLSRQKSKYQKEILAKRRQAASLEAEIKRVIGKNSKVVDYTLGGKFASNQGKLPWPVDEGSVTARFGKQYHPVFKSLQMPFNNGITLAVAPETKVRAVYDGTIAQITVLPGYHQCILVQHGNYYTLYCKIKSVFVKAGQKVKTGDYLGTVDTIDGETAFHFEIWNNKTQPQNPESWLRPR